VHVAILETCVEVHPDLLRSRRLVMVVVAAMAQAGEILHDLVAHNLGISPVVYRLGGGIAHAASVVVEDEPFGA